MVSFDSPLRVPRTAISLLRSLASDDRRTNCLWELTYRCTARCRHCSYWKSPTAPGEELSTGAIVAGLHAIRRAGVAFVNFTGGEPALRKDLEEIVACAAGLGMWPSVVSNGSHIDRARLHALRSAGLAQVFFSLDSSDAAEHDDNRGRPGLFDRVTRLLPVVHDEFVRHNLLGGVMFVVSSRNIDRFAGVLELAVANGVYLVVQPLHAARISEGDPPPPLQHRHVEYLRRVVRRYPHIINTDHFVQRFHQAPSRGADNRALLPSCQAGSKYFCIGPRGEIRPCADGPAVGRLDALDLGVLASPRAKQAIAECEGCWYSYRGEVDVSRQWGGLLEHIVKWASIPISNRRLRRSKLRPSSPVPRPPRESA